MSEGTCFFRQRASASSSDRIEARTRGGFEDQDLPAPSRMDDAGSAMHLVYSFSCNLSCDHCISRCGPEDHRTMGIPRAKRFIEQAARAGIRKIVFTGGEPLLHPRAIRTLIEHAAGIGMESALITNAGWASSRDRVKDHLCSLQKAGLRSITLSTDRYHLLDVPMDRLESVLTVSEEVGLRAGVKIARLAQDAVAEGLYRSLRDHTARVFVQEISPLGRAACLRWALHMRTSSCFLRPGCSTPSVLLPDGSLLTCCNLPAKDVRPEDGPFYLGNVETDSLGCLLQTRSEDPVLDALRSKGPTFLLALLARREPAFRRQARVLYHSGCDLCFHLFCRLPDKRLLYAALRGLSDHRIDEGPAHMQPQRNAGDPG